MHRTTPKVFLVGESSVNPPGMTSYLNHVGASEWKSDAPSDSERLMEFMGRLCYRSWRPGMNANVTKVREGNDRYLKNIINTRHGSVLEHAVTHWVFADVSRILTHELVRHRAGTAVSQESLRFVRLTDLGLWLPPEAEKDEKLKEIFEETFSSLEQLQLRMAEYLGLDDEGKQFKEKKLFTSLMRRCAPEGLSTTIGMSFNFRALRHVLEMRTAESAETEIRLVFDQVGKIAQDRWPNVMGDFKRMENGEWIPESSKV